MAGNKYTINKMRKERENGKMEKNEKNIGKYVSSVVFGGANAVGCSGGWGC